MTRIPMLLAAGLLAAGLPSPAPAQSDPAALQLIEQLRPRPGSPGQTRGIRLPAPADPGATTPSPATPAAVPAPTPVMPPPPTQAAVPVPAQPPAPPRPTPMTVATPVPQGAPSVSITVTFPSGSAALTPQAEAVLAPLGRALASPDLAPFRFRIEGHTDTVGDAMNNQRLSERRAETVRAYLIQRFGVSPQRLEAVGLGEARPAVPTGDNTDEPRNRRVQVINLDG